MNGDILHEKTDDSKPELLASPQNYTTKHPLEQHMKGFSDLVPVAVGTHHCLGALSNLLQISVEK